jgi:hypothetical protein
VWDRRNTAFKQKARINIQNVIPNVKTYLYSKDHYCDAYVRGYSAKYSVRELRAKEFETDNNLCFFTDKSASIK